MHFSDLENVYMEDNIKIQRIKVWHDKYFVYGIQVFYLTSDGFTVIPGKK